MSASAVPTDVLSQALGEAIRGRRVRAGVFTTFTFDPGFFELHILPVLFERSFSQVDKVRKIQLEDALREIDHLAVYYDRSGLSQDAAPAELDYRRIDLRRKTGVFHPKVTLLLVDEPLDPAEPEGEISTSLLVGTASANLTRAGWWENLECAHFEEVLSDELSAERCSYRKDLLSLLQAIERCSPGNEEHVALEAIRGFLRNETPKGDFKAHRTRGTWRTRLFCGQQGRSLPAWLESIRVGQRDWNLEVISPYFDARGARPLEELLEVLGPKEARVLLPLDASGAAEVGEETYEAVGDLARWAVLPSELTSRGRGEASERLPARRVHAKVIRIWKRGGQDLLLMGSANLTTPGFSASRSGNLEAGFLVDAADLGLREQWWLEPLDQQPERFAESTPSEEEEGAHQPIDVSVRFDWEFGRAAVRIDHDPGGEAFVEVCDPVGPPLERVRRWDRGAWTELSPEASQQLGELLRSTSFLLLRFGGHEWRVLVREESMAHRPSLLLELTPEEILQYWSLLTPDQRSAFLESRLAAQLPGLQLDGLSVAPAKHRFDQSPMFDRFAGIYHAFGCLQRYVDDAIDEGREGDAEQRLLGAKYDSLPNLLRKTLEHEDGDLLGRYVTFLCARQLLGHVEAVHGGLLRDHRQKAHELERLIAAGHALRNGLGVEGPDAAVFLDWYEEQFLRDASGAGR